MSATTDASTEATAASEGGQSARERVHTFLDLSAYHLSSTEETILRRESSDALYPLPRVIRHDHGYFVNVPDLDAVDFADRRRARRLAGDFPALAEVLTLARELGCWWVNLDYDLDPVVELPTYEW